MNKALKAKIHESWLPKLKERFESKGLNISESKMKTIAELAHVRKIYENATVTNVHGRGAFSFGNNPASGGSDTAKGSGEVFQDLFGVFLDTAATTVGMDILPTVPMSKSNINVYVVEPIYGGGTMETKDKPKLFMVRTTGVGSPTPLVKGTPYTVSIADGTGGTLTVELVGKDRLKGFDIFKIVSTLAGGTNLTVAESLNFDDNDFGIYQSPTKYYKFDVTTLDYVNGFNNFVSGFTGAGLNDDEAWTSNRNDGKTSSSSPMSRQTGERTYYRSMGLRQWSKNYSAETYHVDIEYTTEQIQDMKMDHDVDALEIGESVLRDQLAQSLNGNILFEVFRNGWQHHYDMFTASNGEFNINSYLDANTNTSSAYSFIGTDDQMKTIDGVTGELQSATGWAENMSTLQRRIVSRLAYASSIVKVRSRRGKGNTIVLNATHGSALQDIKGYATAPFSNSLTEEDGLDFAGEFRGISVYEDSLMDLTDNRIAVFRKGGERDPGLKFCPYLLSEKISTIAEGTMSFKEALKSRYAIVGAGSNPQLNYMTLNVESGEGYNIV